MPKGSSANKLAREARFVFKGTVRKLKAATIPDIKDKSSTVIVTVDEIIHAPEEMSYFGGHEITVQISGKKQVKVGQQAIFYTNAWLFGDSIAVVSLGHHTVEEVPAALAVAMTTGDPVKNLATVDMKNRYESAQLVVSGRVRSVQLPADSISKLASAAEPITPFSEHDPMWHEAIVDVATVHKGSHDQKRVTLRFPASQDVMWFKAPKFRPGHEGVFMLQKSKVKEHALSAAAAGTIETTEAYTCMDPADFQAVPHAEEVNTLLSLISEP
jgi:hypothetical protein